MVDTNVVVSAYLSAFGQPARVLDLILSGQAKAVLDERILIEYRQVLSRPRFGIAPANVDDLLEFLAADGEVVHAAPLKLVIPDESNLPFIEVAVSAQVDALITGNQRRFPKAPIAKLGVKILSPAEFLRSL